MQFTKEWLLVVVKVMFVFHFNYLEINLRKLGRLELENDIYPAFYTYIETNFL